MNAPPASLPLHVHDFGPDLCLSCGGHAGSAARERRDGQAGHDDRLAREVSERHVPSSMLRAPVAQQKPTGFDGLWLSCAHPVKVPQP